MTIEIYDDFLVPSEHEKLEELFLGKKEYGNYTNSDFPWFWGTIIGGSSEYDPLNNRQLSSLIYDYNHNAGHLFCGIIPQTNPNNLKEILSDPRLNVAALCRIKANLSPRTVDHNTNGFHIDLPYKCTTGIFYVNTNNGWTEFEDGTKVECVANRMITFPSYMRHAGVTTTDSHCKVLINFNYFEVIQHDSSVQEKINYYGNTNLKENGSNN
tara:strand:- start:146 stop:781 length:636 start_codon:yes stop_codon:yes gene_type:complete